MENFFRLSTYVFSCFIRLIRRFSFILSLSSPSLFLSLSVYDVKRYGENPCKQITITDPPSSSTSLNCRWWIGRRVKKKWGWNWPLCAHGRGKRGQAHSEQSEQVWKCFKRDSRPVCIPAGKLMPLVPGDKFPADAYLFPSFSIQPALFRCVPNDVRSFNLCNCSASTRYAIAMTTWRSS